MSLPRRRRLTWWLNGLGAVLIVGGSIGVTFSLVNPSRDVSSSASVWEGGGQYTRAAEWGGLSVVMTVTPGPYFVGELLLVDLSLTNSSSTSYTLAGDAVADLCGGAVYATTSGGTSPRNALPVFPYPYCPFLWTVLTPGKTLMFHQVLPLSRSGNVLLQSGADFLKTQMDPDRTQETVAGKSPLDGYWPSFRLSVAPTVPSGRRITLQRLGTTIYVTAPVPARAHLYAISSLGCNDPVNDSHVGSGMSIIGGWGPLSQPLLQEPACEEPNDPHVRWATVDWTYAVSAPGFDIASGEVG
jgi:hypothetical protein